MELIKQTNRYYDTEPGVEVLDHDARDEIAALLEGHKVTKVADDHLLLDDGTILKIVGHDGGCSCGAGDYDLESLNGVDNVITRVEFDYHPGGDYEPVPDRLEGEDEWTGHYRIFVFAEDRRIMLMNVLGSDGNGYYGTGYSILVRRVER